MRSRNSSRSLWRYYLHKRVSGRGLEARPRGRKSIINYSDSKVPLLMSGFITSPRLAETVQLTILDVYLGKQWNLLRGLASSAPQCGHFILDRLISSSVRSCKHVLFSHLTIIPVLRVMRPLVSSMPNTPSRTTSYFIIFLTRMQPRPFIWLIWQAIGIRSLLCGQKIVRLRFRYGANCVGQANLCSAGS